MAEKFPVPPLPYDDPRANYNPADSIPLIQSLAEAKRHIAEIAQFLAPYSAFDAVLGDGTEVEILAILRGMGAPDPTSAWTLIRDDSHENEYRVDPGKIYLDYGMLDSPQEIEDIDKTFPIDRDGWVWIEMDISDAEQPKLALKYGKQWEWFPAPYKEQGAPSTVRKAAFPIWQFRSGGKQYASEAVIEEGRVAEKFLYAAHSMVTWGIHASVINGRNDRTFAPILIPLA